MTEQPQDRGDDNGVALTQIRLVRVVALDAIKMLGGNPEGTETRRILAFMDGPEYVPGHTEKFHDPDEAAMIVALQSFVDATARWTRTSRTRKRDN